MKVLHLPTNIASQMSVTVAALRQAGVDAVGLSGPSIYQEGSGLRILPQAHGGPFLRRVYCAAARHAAILKTIAWADVVHWHYGSALRAAADLRLAAFLGRKRFVEFWGSDIRDPELEMADNPYYAAAWQDPAFECRGESRELSGRTQSLFARHGARALIPSPGMAQYVDPGAFPDFTRTTQRVLLDVYQPVFPVAAHSRPLIVHAPTAPVFKGSRYIMAAAERLQERFDFDFKIITRVPKEEARLWLARCDIFVDQLIAGEYGLAAVEAMALGKPVVCYIKPSLVSRYPAGLPVMSASPDTIESVLATLLSDGALRRRTGELSRAWVEEHHDAARFARRLIDLYQSV